MVERSGIRSFVLRQGRMTPAQARAFTQHWPRYGLELSGAAQDFTCVFQRKAPLVLEIGFGNGEALHHAALHEPEKNFIGVEVHRPGVGRLLNVLAKDNLENVRVFHKDAFEILDSEIAIGCLDEVRIYFPDPWPKQRHHKRRLVQPEFLSLLASRVRTGGLLHLATDWAEYAQFMQKILNDSTDWSNANSNGGFSARPDWRIETHFERRGGRLGHGSWDLIYLRKSQSPVAD